MFSLVNWWESPSYALGSSTRLLLQLELRLTLLVQCCVPEHSDMTRWSMVKETPWRWDWHPIILKGVFSCSYAPRWVILPSTITYEYKSLAIMSGTQPPIEQVLAIHYGKSWPWPPIWQILLQCHQLHGQSPWSTWNPKDWKHRWCWRQTLTYKLEKQSSIWVLQTINQKTTIHWLWTSTRGAPSEICENSCLYCTKPMSVRVFFTVWTSW